MHSSVGDKSGELTGVEVIDVPSPVPNMTVSGALEGAYAVLKAASEGRDW